jgi:hypothetical protein
VRERERENSGWENVEQIEKKKSEAWKRGANMGTGTISVRRE